GGGGRPSCAGGATPGTGGPPPPPSPGGATERRPHESLCRPSGALGRFSTAPVPGLTPRANDGRPSGAGAWEGLSSPGVTTRANDGRPSGAEHCHLVTLSPCHLVTKRPDRAAHLPHPQPSPRLVLSSSERSTPLPRDTTTSPGSTPAMISVSLPARAPGRTVRVWNTLRPPGSE